MGVLSKLIFFFFCKTKLISAISSICYHATQLSHLFLVPRLERLVYKTVKSSEVSQCLVPRSMLSTQHKFYHPQRHLLPGHVIYAHSLMELGRCTNSDNVTIYLYIVKCRWNRRKCSYKGFLMKWYQLSVEDVSNQMSDTHSPQQVVQHNDAKCNNSLGTRTRIVSIPDFYSHFQAQIS